MTYPPQQPGTGGWGQPSDNGFPQQDPAQAPQQQPAWYGNQHTELGAEQQATQYISPAAGFGNPQQQPAAPQWDGGQFPPGGGWVSEPDGFAAVEPTQPKSKMPWVLGGVGAVVVLGGAAVGLYFLMGGGPGEADPVAQEVVDKVNAHDFQALEDKLCQENKAELQSQLEQLEAGRFNIRLGEVIENGNEASAQLKGSWEMGGVSQPVDQVMGLTVENGEWKVCDLDQ
ncbi:Rv0361 family membrane protein [Saccharopolyspora rectivirgula]|jgi:hypothetical protein|uniref:DUF4878 domain-containing protein n=1 Tax=Saccharopolyspora rectivirgula TaxID=28042 RepID=A0A073AYN8_9PSEU|nr:hypothetical protein [Saccharopolyspora rectivirgula]KEI44903.1 hypothetical protein GU90_06660 [Saccharopolyspora rectivirgula]